jgi:hypothetical protein
VMVALLLQMSVHSGTGARHGQPVMVSFHSVQITADTEQQCSHMWPAQPVNAVAVALLLSSARTCSSCTLADRFEGAASIVNNMRL